MLALISLGSILILTPVLYITYLIATLIIIPYLKVKSYKKDDVEAIFYPIAGYFQHLDNTFVKHGDKFATAKSSSKDYPNQKYGVSNLKGQVLFHLRDPQYVKECLQKPHLYKKSDMLDIFRVSVRNGLVFAEGEMWRAHRRFISKSFHYEFLKDNVPMIQETTQEFFDKLTPEELNNYSTINRIQHITGEIVGRIFFGKNLKNYTVYGKALTIETADQIAELAQFVKHPLMIMLGPKILSKVPLCKGYQPFLKRAEGVRAVVRQIIQDRRSQKVQAKDLLGLLLLSQQEADLKERYSDEDIIDEFLTFFVAGMDTTGHLIGMTLYNLTQHPEYLEELEQERKTLYNNGGKIQADSVNKMDVLHLHLKETLRMYTPAAGIFLRNASVDHKILDLDIKKGDFVQPDFMALMFDEKHFKDPYHYNPNRWRDPDAKLDPYAYTPFSAGPRNCIGQHLAIMESKIIMSEFLNRFDFKLIDGYKLRMTARFLQEPHDELLLNLKLKTN